MNVTVSIGGDMPCITGTLNNHLDEGVLRGASVE